MYRWLMQKMRGDWGEKPFFSRIHPWSQITRGLFLPTSIPSESLAQATLQDTHINQRGGDRLEFSLVSRKYGIADCGIN